MNQQEKDKCESIIRQLPCDLVYIDTFVAKPEQAERVRKLCEFLNCNEKLLSHRILGWKQYECR